MIYCKCNQMPECCIHRSRNSFCLLQLLVVKEGPCSTMDVVYWSFRTSQFISINILICKIVGLLYYPIYYQFILALFCRHISKSSVIRARFLTNDNWWEFSTWHKQVVHAVNSIRVYNGVSIVVKHHVCSFQLLSECYGWSIMIPWSQVNTIDCCWFVAFECNKIPYLKLI